MLHKAEHLETLATAAQSVELAVLCNAVQGLGSDSWIGQLAPDSFGQQTAGQQTQRQSPSATRQPLRALYVVNWRGLARYTQDEHPLLLQ